MRGRRSLARAIEEYLTEWSERTGVAVEVWAMPKERVTGPVADAVYAVVLEALSNVEQHSGAHTVSVALTVGPGGLRVTVSDNGIGFQPGRTGRGVDTMKRRFSEVGGTLTVNSVVGEGTTVSGRI
ncbi:sensor histidine kinase [Sphaerisporangium fuscum]|uniref:sensor histidine kinase n=1 Tax=Sphaerisporangium fuscum TaxID=2835868 RepID=UPI001BDC2C39|nr:ATP-binding protein [Sphaerisporangium fuscum]